MRHDVVLCDIGLPDGNGFVVAAALREEPATSGARCCCESYRPRLRSTNPQLSRSPITADR